LISEAAKPGQKKQEKQNPARELIHATYPLHVIPAGDKLQKPRAGERRGCPVESRHLKKTEKGSAALCRAAATPQSDSAKPCRSRAGRAGGRDTKECKERKTKSVFIRVHRASVI
jgi:hypothetical protein